MQDRFLGTAALPMDSAGRQICIVGLDVSRDSGLAER